MGSFMTAGVQKKATTRTTNTVKVWRHENPRCLQAQFANDFSQRCVRLPAQVSQRSFLRALARCQAGLTFDTPTNDCRR